MFATQPTKEQIEKDKKEREEREKLRMTNWEDLNVDQKIDRMKEYVQSNTRLAGDANRSINGLKDSFKKHIHKDGRIYTEYSGYDNAGSQGVCESSRQAQNYF